MAERMTEVPVAKAHEVLSRWLLADGLPVECDLEKSRGAYLHDARTGKEYLDFFSFYAARPLGFNHPKLRSEDFLERLRQADVLQAVGSVGESQERARFAEVFSRVALGNDFRASHFTAGSDLGAEGALRAALAWKQGKNEAARRPKKSGRIVSFRQGCHGRSGYALALCDSPLAGAGGSAERQDWPRVTNPKMRFPFDAAALFEVEALERAALVELEAIFAADAHATAAIIIEPIQSEGGDNHFRTEFFRALRALCDEHEALLIFDEVQTGFGVTGKWWAWQHHDVRPDLLIFGKKTQVGGFAATARLDEVAQRETQPEPGEGSFGGTLVDLVRCERVMEIIVEEHLLDSVQAMGRYLMKLLFDQAASHVEISNVRGRGLLAAFDVPSRDERDRLVRACLDEELIVLPCGERSVQFRPALDIDADAIGRAAAQLEAALRRAYARK